MTNKYKKTSYLFILLLVTFFSSVATAWAQDCGCDHIIEASQEYMKAEWMKTPVKPGDVICIKSGVRGRLKLLNFQGTKDKPLTFKNCGGQVIFDNTQYDGTFIFENCSYFRVTGTGTSGVKYGFKIRKATKNSAMFFTGTDFEIDHLEIADAGFAGIMAKIDPNCNNTQYHRGNFVMRNISIHDNYIHHTKGEGLYIGNTSYNGLPSSCGPLLPHEIHNVQIFNNLLEEIGADGIQLSCATRDAKIYNNIVKKYGVDPFAEYQNNGIIIGGGTTGLCYNNLVIDGSGTGITCFGIGNNNIFNNVVVRPKGDGIFIDERTPLLNSSGFHASNNTIVSPSRDGIRMYSRKSVGNTFYNNLIVNPGSKNDYINKSPYVFIIDNTVKYSESNGYYAPNIADAKFVNPAIDNYQLTASSPAIDRGKDLTSKGIIFDFNNQKRPSGNGFDAGAFEFASSSTVTQPVPTPSNLIWKTSGSKGFALTWKDNSSNETNFIIEKSSSSAFSKELTTNVTLGKNITTYLDTIVSPNKVYFYRIKAKNATAESDYSNSVEAVLKVSGLNTTDDGDYILLYPNPVENMLQIKASNSFDPIHIQLISCEGKRIMNTTVLLTSAESSEAIDISGIPSGLYQVVILQGKNRVTDRIIKY